MIVEEKISMHLICFSHLSWKFVYQRPQHIIKRFTSNYGVYYIEEYTYTDEEDGYSISLTDENVTLIVPHLNHQHKGNKDASKRVEEILKNLFKEHSIYSYVFWYYTPMALVYTANFNPIATVYDCMDELSAFKFAPPELKILEQDLFEKVDIVFTGGNSLYKAKKSQHPKVYSFPSSIDKAHFKAARNITEEPKDQTSIPHPRLGFYGVIDERFDIELIREAAEARPDWHFVLIGPVVKIDPAILPQHSNIHYLGAKNYEQLPIYLAGWDIALIPFAINESTKYISPTKTPEYLSGGKPVISTAITDVIDPYYNLGLVHIVHNAEEFCIAADGELNQDNRQKWLSEVDKYLSGISWDATWKCMNELLQKEVDQNQKLLTDKFNEYVRLFNSGSRTGRVGASREIGHSSQ